MNTKKIPTLVFKVQGSSSDPYTVTIKRRSETNLSAYCTCQAGEKGTHCKHRLRILTGNVDNVVSGNQNEIVTVLEWMRGSDIEQIINRLIAAEDALYEANIDVKACKRALAKALLD